MAIPQSFKEKYSLTGETYEKRNVDLALSDLFAASTRLYADNAELRRQVNDIKAERNSLAAQLKEAKSAPATEAAPSMTAKKLDEIVQRLDALEAKIGANAGVLGEKLAAIAEALSDAVVYTAADDALSAEEEALADAEALEYVEDQEEIEEEAEELSPEAASAAVRTVEVEPTLDFSEPIEEESAGEAFVEDAPSEDAPVEDAPTEEAPVEEAPAEEAPAEEAPAEDAPVEEAPVEEAPTEEAPAEEAPAEEAPVEEAPAENASVEEAPAEEAPAEENADADSEPSREEIIKAAGLEDEVEDIEPSEPIPDDSVAKMLAALYSSPTVGEESAEEPAEESADEETSNAPQHDGGTVSGMRNSLDAIRRRREMKK